jgi:hypothetical protein
MRLGYRSSGHIPGQLLDLLECLPLVEHEKPTTDETGGCLPAETATRHPSGTPDVLEFAHVRKIIAAQDQLPVVALTAESAGHRRGQALLPPPADEHGCGASGGHTDQLRSYGAAHREVMASVELAVEVPEQPGREQPPADQAT